jgi:hypothetical protein
VWSLPRPARHHDVIRAIAEVTGAATVDASGDDQGFLDADGRYLRRAEALQSAQANGQLKDGALGPSLGKLFSEDVW